jgi:Fe2+ or Zn2+ uptake regulation protein
MKCGYVGDFVVSDSTERAIDAALTQAARKSKFIAKGHRLDVLGLCVQCTAAR